MQTYKLICCVVRHAHGSKTLKAAKALGIKGGTIFLARGTAKSWLLDMLSLSDSHKEIVWMGAEQDTVDAVMDKIAQDMALHKHGNGIAFSMPLINYIGTGHFQYEECESGTEGATMYQAIFAVVERGLAEEVMEAATGAGAKGGTIWNARGAGIHETATLFAMLVEPEREIVMIVVEGASVETITDAIRKKLHIDEPGNGVVFTVPLDKVCGIHEALGK